MTAGVAGGAIITGETMTAAIYNDKMWLVDTGANINAFTPLVAGMHAFCTSTGNGFTVNHSYEYDGTQWRDLTGTIMVLINADDTDGTNVQENTTEQISKSYTLAANSYSKIIVEAVVHITQGSFTGARSVTVNILIGATSKQYFHQINSANNMYIEYDSPMKVSASLQAGGTIKVRIPAGSATQSQFPSIQVKNMYVYGVYV